MASAPEMREPRHQAARQDLLGPTGLAGSLGSLQRFLCRSCGRTFTFPRRAARPRARFADDAIEEAVRLSVQDLCSYRVLAVLLEQRLGRPVGGSPLTVGWTSSGNVPRLRWRSPRSFGLEFPGSQSTPVRRGGPGRESTCVGGPAAHKRRRRVAEGK